MIRGSLTLPHGSGKTIRVAVFCKGEDAKKAREAGADIVGDDDLIEKVAGGFLDFDAAISTPEMMKNLSKLGKVLGPRGLMPNPKTGTVTADPAKAIKEVKAGKIEFRLDKLGNINVIAGKVSFDNKTLCENAIAIIDAILKAKPRGVKPPYIKNVYVSSTMGPGIALDLVKAGKAA
ncbi:MAG: 50S ribosomal protein L1 [Candidatus Omnitrophica bacterium CG1_02_49_10]|nr:MAG: 50S ribosomal protein L1 [Candidatus Omnitrophica bacterium CG1_02_49_10]